MLYNIFSITILERVVKIMGRKKEVILYNDRYMGKYLDEKTCNTLEALLKLQEDNGKVEDLKNIIYDLNPSDIEMIRERGDNTFTELREGELEDHQTIGVAYMYFAKRLLLGDSVGLGKTVEICGLCNLLERDMKKEGYDFRCLVLTEKTLVEETTKKMVQFTGNYYECLYGEKDNILKYQNKWDDEELIPPNTVGAHSLLTSVHFQEFMIGFKDKYGCCPYDLLVIDESGSTLINSSTQSYKNALYLSKMFDRIVLANATSFEGALEHFYNQLSFIDDSFLPTKTEFNSRYKEYTYGIRKYPIFQGKYKNQEEFKNLIGYRYLKRTRKSLGAEMKDCTAEIIVTELSSVQKKLLPNVSIPNMVYDCPSYFSKYTPGLETNTSTTPKLRELIKLVDKLKDKGSILVYSRYKEAQACIADELSECFIDCEIINGDTSIKERTNIVNKFKLGDIKVLITNVQKGLDFGNCNYCIFYDYDPSPDKMTQFEGRTTRSRDIIGKHVYLLVSKGKELSTLKKVISEKAKASDLFSGSDYSCVLELLLDEGKLKDLK